MRILDFVELSNITINEMNNFRLGRDPSLALLDRDPSLNDVKRPEPASKMGQGPEILVCFKNGLNQVCPYRLIRANTDQSAGLSF